MQEESKTATVIPVNLPPNWKVFISNSKSHNYRLGTLKRKSALLSQQSNNVN